MTMTHAGWLGSISRTAQAVMAGLLLAGCVAREDAGAMSAAPEPLAPGYGLETADQRAVEALSLRLMESPGVKAALAQLEQSYREDPTYALPGAARFAMDAARELAYRTVTYVVTEDPLRPKFLWTYNATRQSAGVTIPGTTFIESVDSVYRVVTVGAGHHYEITGRRPENGPAFLTFEVWNAAQGLQPAVKYVAHLQQDKMTFAADGSFTVLVGPEPANGRANYLQLPEGGWILVRQSLSDWNRQTIIADLQVRLLDPVDRPAPGFAELEQRVAAVMPQSFAVNRLYMRRMFEDDGRNMYIGFGNTLNHLKPTVATRGGAWGYVTGTLYHIPRDKALVVTIDTADARYFAIQLHDAWGRTLDPVFLTNRNNGGSKPNPDGTVTFVLSERDPGEANWLDTRGIESGSLILRWQGVTPPADGSQAAVVRDSQWVDFAKLDSVLPEGTPRVTAAERREELRRRKLGYERRLR